MSGGRPLNFGLTDAVSRIGGWQRPEIPSLLDGIQPVMVYGDVSKSVASEVFEARGIVGASTGEMVYNGFEISSEAPGGIVIEEIDAELFNDAGLPMLGLNIVTTSVGGAVIPHLDAGGVDTLSRVRALAAPVAFGGLLSWTVNSFTGGGIFQGIQNRTRIWTPPGSYFQVFPVGLGHWFNIGMHVTWRELADVQGTG